MKKLRNKATIIFLVMVLTIVFPIAEAAAIKMPISEKMKKLIDERQVDCWVEGEVFGDMILGARGLINFIYIDAKLSKAISEEHSLDSWVDDLNQYFGSPQTVGKALFIAQIEANKPWDFKVEEIRIGDYHLDKNDIISPSWKNPTESLDPGKKWQFAFVVPISEMKYGKEIPVGYGNYLIKWRVPK